MVYQPSSLTGITIHSSSRSKVSFISKFPCLAPSTAMQIGDWPTHLTSYLPEVNTYDTNSNMTCYTHVHIIKDGKQSRITLELKNQEFRDKE